MQRIITALLLIVPVSAYAGVDVVPEPEVLPLLAAGVAVAVAVKFMKRKK
jgi:hypothetical protein